MRAKGDTLIRVREVRWYKCTLSTARRSNRGRLFLRGGGMGTVVFYLDESGSTGSFTLPIQSGQTPVFTLTAIALQLERWRDFDRHFNSMKGHFFPEELARKGRKENIEIKGNDLSTPRNRDSHRRHDFLNQTLNLLKDEDAKAFCVTFLKSDQRPMSSKSMYTHGLQVLLERFNHYMVNFRPRDSSLIICDSRAGAIAHGSLDKEVAQSYLSYIFGNPKGKQMTSIHEAPLFADSKITVGVQLADILSSCIYTNHYYYYTRSLLGAVDYRHMQRYWPQIDALQYKYAGVDSGDAVYGFRVIDQRNP